jgi:hypothetical protein
MDLMKDKYGNYVI